MRDIDTCHNISPLPQLSLPNICLSSPNTPANILVYSHKRVGHFECWIGTAGPSLYNFQRSISTEGSEELSLMPAFWASSSNATDSSGIVHTEYDTTDWQGIRNSRINQWINKSVEQTEWTIGKILTSQLQYFFWFPERWIFFCCNAIYLFMA